MTRHLLKPCPQRTSDRSESCNEEQLFRPKATALGALTLLEINFRIAVMVN